MTKEEADRVISCWTLLNTQTNKYECTVCGGAFQVREYTVTLLMLGWDNAYIGTTEKIK
jgi:hypothetical protein